MTHTSTEQPEVLKKAGVIAFRLSRSGDKQAAASIRALLARVQELEASQAQRVPIKPWQTDEIPFLRPVEAYDQGWKDAEAAHGITQEKQG